MENATVDPQNVLTISPSVTYTEMDEGIVVLNIETGQYYGLNETAGFIYSLINQNPCSVDDIVQAMIREFEVDESILRQDVNAVIGDMQNRGIVRAKIPVKA